MKRCFDLAVTILALLLLAPLMVILGVLIFFKLGSPVLYTQMRPGYNGKLFKLVKFRSMKEAYDQEGNLLPDSERLNAFGKLLRASSLDELPELLNVLLGEMSLVGPRPLLVEYLELYNDEQARRHEVRPGITGWAQVHGRNNLSWEKKFEYDVWYVNNRTFLLDLKILFMTLGKALSAEGVNQSGHVTAEKFKGTKEDGR